MVEDVCSQGVAVNAVILCLPFFSSGVYTREIVTKFCHSRLGYTVTRHVSAESFTVIPCVNSTLREFSSAIELEVFVEQDCNQFPLP